MSKIDMYDAYEKYVKPELDKSKEVDTSAEDMFQTDEVDEPQTNDVTPVAAAIDYKALAAAMAEIMNRGGDEKDGD